MRMASSIGCLVLVVALGPWPDVADAASRGKACRRACRAAIDACVAGGEKRRRCRRRTLKECRRDGLAVCSLASTTTTTASGATTTQATGTNTTTTGTGGTSTSTTMGPPVNGCTVETATDLRNAVSPTISFGGLAYDPACVRVAPGQSVTFSGSFASHPLVGGTVSGGSKIPDASSPIPATSSGTTRVVVFPAPGTFPYYCNVHALVGMFGAVFVEP